MSANVTTLNQVVNNLREIANQHRQINEFQFGNPWEFYTSGIAVTPVMWVQVLPSDANRNTITFKFRTWLLDSVKSGDINETEVLSDMYQVGQDVIAQLRHPDYNWAYDFDATAVLNPVTEHSPYKVTGVWFDFEIKLLYPSDRCAIAFVSEPTGSSSSTNFFIQIIDINTGEVIENVQVGSTYSVYQFSIIDGGGSSTTYTDIIVANP